MSTKQIAAPLSLTFKDASHDERQSNSVSHAHHSHEREFFVNNAKIVDEKKSLRSTQKNEQVLFVIDEVLEPYIPSSGGQAPTANEFIQKQTRYDTSVDDHYDIFAQAIRNHRLDDLFSRPGNHTFFVPLIKSTDKSRLKNLDEIIVRAHVIPNRALYFRTLDSSTEYRTAAWDENSQVGVSLPIPAESTPKQVAGNNRIQSRTHKVTGNHHIGLVRTNVVTANIPVRNGVVHLIEKPFMIVDVSIWDFIENNKDGQISQFAALLQKSSSVLSRLRSGNDITIFAPNNHAFEKLGDLKLKQLLANPKEAEELVGLHIVTRTISTEDVRTGKQKELLSLDGKRSLYLQVAQASPTTEVLTVEGGGVNATAIQADIGATNGMVHIIDKVLGIPFQTVFEKLKDDFDLSTTYQVGAHRNNYWNKKLADTTHRFTYFAPSKAAWDELKKLYPSEYKQLTEGILPVHGEQVINLLFSQVMCQLTRSFVLV